MLAERDLIAAYSVKVIDLNALKSDRFATTVRFLLEELIERGTLQIEEIDLFKGVIEWATKRSQEQGRQTDGQQIRRILGERIIQAIWLLSCSWMNLFQRCVTVKSWRTNLKKSRLPLNASITLKEKSTMKRRCGLQKSTKRSVLDAHVFPSSAC